MRHDGRTPDELRPVRIRSGVLDYAEGSALVEFGRTRVLCAATIETSVPGFLKGSGQGWVTAEYGMLPRATATRTPREAARGKQGGRTLEIQRLIGRSLRAVSDLAAFGERTVRLDCDVLQADGGTRTASVTGAYVALAAALGSLVEKNLMSTVPLRGMVAAVSVGIYGGRLLLDLDYREDSRADIDMNVVMTDDGQLVEVQATGEDRPFSRAQLDGLLDLAAGGIDSLVVLQREALATRPADS